MSERVGDAGNENGNEVPKPAAVVAGDYLWTETTQGDVSPDADEAVGAPRESRAARRARQSERRNGGLRGGGRTGNARRIGRSIVIGLGIVGLVLVLLTAGVLTVNGIARWNARRAAAKESAPTAAQEKSRGNLLMVSEKDGRADGFLALRVDEQRNQVFGIAIPDAAFLEVPGQGFERVGDSYLTGPEVSMSAISNFLSVPFDRYIVVPQATYQTALREQNMRGVIESASKTNLSQQEAEDLAGFLDRVSTKDVALVPLEVKPITVGSQTYFEPQRAALADLLESWWGVKLSEAENVVRLIVYNGAGKPGIAGDAAQQLIRGGFRVVDTKNADRFDYKTTQIVVQDKDMTAGQKVKKVLGTGNVVSQPSDQDVADVIVIIGRDYKPSKSATTP